MAATLDDLLALAAGIRVDLRGLRTDMKRPTGPSSPPPAGGGGGGGSGSFMSGLTGGLAKVVGVIGAAERALVAFGSQLVGFVSKANPAAVQRFHLALSDLQGIIGHTLTPVLERVTLLIRMMGDAFASLSPRAKQLVAGLASGMGLAAALGAVAVAVKALVASLGPIPVIAGVLASAFAGVAFSMASGQQISEAFRAVLKALGGVIETLARVVVPAVAGVLVPALSALAKILGALGGNVVILTAVAVGVAHALGLVTITLTGLGTAAKFAAKAFLIGVALQVLAPLLDKLSGALKFLTDIVGDFLDMIGLGSDYDPSAKSSVGAAVRQAQIGDMSSFANKAYTSAYGGSASDIPGQSLGELKGIRKGIDDLPSRIAAKSSTAPGYDGTAGDRGRSIVKHAAAGAAIGSFVPGVGTAAGAVVGGTIGVMRNLFG